MLNKFTRPETLVLLTEEQLQELRAQDYTADKKENEQRDSWVSFDSRSRKWHSKMIDAKSAWDKLLTITEEQFYEVIYWLSVTVEPCNPNGFGRPGKVKELARDIKYCMSLKQRAVAYTIITNRFNSLAAN